jgi:lipoprotein-anchoring transpeptidase ErfK/SrfK
MTLVGLGGSVSLLACLAASGAMAMSAASRAGACPTEPAPSVAVPATRSAATTLRSTQAVLPVVGYQANGVAVGPTRALVGGFVPGGEPVSLLAEYGSSRNYGSCSLWEKAATSQSVVKIALEGLHPAAMYHFRLVAKTVAGTVFGADRMFRTLADGRIPQGVKVGSVVVGGMSRVAALSLIVRPLGSPLRMSFEGAVWHVTRAQAGARIDSTRAVAAALKASPDQLLTPATISVDRARLRAYLMSLKHRWNRKNRPGGVSLVGTRAVVMPVRKVIEVDTRRMAALIDKELTTGGQQLLPLAVKTAPTKSMLPQRAVVVRLGSQTLTAYLNGKPVLTTPITTGRSALPTPIGSYHIIFRASPFVFHSPWPPGNPYWYPPTPVTWAMDFVGGDFLHDDPGEPTGAYGAGSEYGPYASHGCVHVPHDSMAFLYTWLPVGAPVIVAQQ